MHSRALEMEEHTEANWASQAGSKQLNSTSTTPTQQPALHQPPHILNLWLLTGFEGLPLCLRLDVQVFPLARWEI